MAFPLAEAPSADVWNEDLAVSGIVQFVEGVITHAPSETKIFGPALKARVSVGNSSILFNRNYPGPHDAELPLLLT